MTIHNAVKYGTDVLRGFSRFIGLDETEEGTVRLGETLTPIIDAWKQPELAFLMGETLCAYSRNVSAVAGQLSGVALCNPTVLRMIMVVEEASILSTANQDVGMFLVTDADAASNLGSSSQGNSRDRRSGALVSRAVVRYGTVVALFTASILEANRKAAAETIRFQNVPVILAPGQGLLLWHFVANTFIHANFKWRERRLRPAELVGG